MPSTRPLPNDVERGLLQEILCIVSSNTELEPRHPHEARKLPRVAEYLLRHIGTPARRRRDRCVMHGRTERVSMPPRTSVKEHGHFAFLRLTGSNSLPRFHVS